VKKKIKFSGISIACLFIIGVLANLSNTYAVVPGVNTLVSVNNTGDGQGGNGNSPAVSGNMYAPISANGRYVLFSSRASNLVSGDTNGYSDLFLRDLKNSTTTRVNVSTSGVQGDAEYNLGGYQQQVISSNGRYIVFWSNATNLIDGQTTTKQLYMRDTVTNTTSIVTQKSDGTLGNGNVGEIGGVSNDGRFVVWKGARNSNLQSSGPNVTGSRYIYLADLSTRTFTLLNNPTSATSLTNSGISMNCDGSLIAFVTNEALVASDTDTQDDVYLLDIRNGNVLISLSATMSNPNSYTRWPVLSCNGEYLTFAGDNDGSYAHQFLYDRINSTVSIVDTSTSGTPANSDISYLAGVDDNGNVAFISSAKNLVAGVAGGTYNRQVYLKNRETGVTELISRNAAGVQANGTFSVGPVTLSADGKTAVYGVFADTTNLISSDTNGYGDVIASQTGL